MTDERKTGARPEAVCERLGDLLAAAVPDEKRAPDTQQWAAIEAQLDRRRSRRRPLLPALAMAALLLAATGTWLVARRPLRYHVEDCTLMADGSLTAPRAGAIAFSDGSKIELAAGASLQVEPLPFARGAELRLDDGEARLAVVHRPLTRWAVRAGPFRVAVTGTRFSVSWSKQQRQLRIAMQEGEVHVTGGRLDGDVLLRAGQTLESSADGPAAPPAAAPPRPSPPVDEATPPPVAAAPSTPRTAPAPARPPAPAPIPRRRAEVVGTAPARPQGADDSASGRTLPAPTSSRAVPESVPPVEPAPARPTTLPLLEVPTPRPAPRPAQPIARRITILPDGSLANGITGFTWVATASGTTLSSPPSNPAVDKSGPLVPKDGKLCVSGTIAGLRCINDHLPKMRCNWKENWGVQIGFHVLPDRAAWGDEAPNAVAIQFSGRTNSYRLNAHRHGDPDGKQYCIADYKSGQAVTAGMFKTECWDDAGETLPDFKGVDHLNLMLPSGMEYAAFRYCITGIQIFP